MVSVKIRSPFGHQPGSRASHRYGYGWLTLLAGGDGVILGAILAGHGHPWPCWCITAIGALAAGIVIGDWLNDQEG